MMIRSEAANRERDLRGNTLDRKARRDWIVSPVAGTLRAGIWVSFGGNGRSVPCVHCGVTVSREAVEIDRIVCGGSYRRDNIQPACFPCNRGRGNRASWVPPLARA